MAVDPFTRGFCPGRARPRHRGSFEPGHERPGDGKRRPAKTISPRARKAIATAAKRVPHGTGLSERHWQRMIDTNPLMVEALQKQGKFTLKGTERYRSREFNMNRFCKDLSAVAMRAIRTDEFVDLQLVQCLTLLGVRDSGEFAKFLAIAAPKRSYLAARPHAEVVEPRQAINPGRSRRSLMSPFQKWRLGYDEKVHSHMAVPVDPALTPEEAYHEIAGSPRNPTLGWDWKFHSPGRCFHAVDLRPKTPILEWTIQPDGITPVPVDPRLTPEQACHPEYGSPLSPKHGWKWEFNPTTGRWVLSIEDEPSRYPQPRFPLPKVRRLYRWHPDEGYFSLVHEDDDDADGCDDNLYEYDTRYHFFKRYQPPTPKSKPEPVTTRRQFFIRLPDGNFAMTHTLDDIFEYDPKKKRRVRLAIRPVAQ